MGKRVYSVNFSVAGATAVQDLIGIYCGASMAVEFHGYVIGQVTGASVAYLAHSIKRLPATVTAGTGGGAGTVNKMARNDAAATATARINDTAQATTSGTAAILHRDTMNIVNGYQFFWPVEDRPTFGLSEAGILSLDTAPGTLTINGTLYFAELIA